MANFDELLDMVDKKKIGLVQGVDISFLSEEAQQTINQGFYIKDSQELYSILEGYTS